MVETRGGKKTPVITAGTFPALLPNTAVTHSAGIMESQASKTIQPGVASSVMEQEGRTAADDHESLRASLRELRKENSAMRDKLRLAATQMERLVVLDDIAAEHKWDLSVVGSALGWDEMTVTTFRDYVDEFGRAVVDLTGELEAEGRDGDGSVDDGGSAATTADAGAVDAGSNSSEKCGGGNNTSAKRKRGDAALATGKSGKIQARHGGCSRNSGDENSISFSSDGSGSGDRSSPVNDGKCAAAAGVAASATGAGSAVDSGEHSSAAAEASTDTARRRAHKKSILTADEIRAMIADGTLPLVDESAIEPAPAPADLGQADVGTLISILDNRNEQLSALETALQRGKAFRALRERDDVIALTRRRKNVERENFVVEYWTGGAAGKGVRTEKDIATPLYKITQANAILQKLESVCEKLSIDETTALRLAARLDVAELDLMLKNTTLYHRSAKYIIIRDFAVIVEAVHGLLQQRRPLSSGVVEAGDVPPLLLASSSTAGKAPMHGSSVKQTLPLRRPTRRLCNATLDV
jgi:hypothetical protein